MNEPFRGNLPKSEFVGSTLIDAIFAFGNGVFLDESRGYYPEYLTDSENIEETLINLTNYEIMNLFPDYYSKYYPDLEKTDARQNPKLKRTIGIGFEVTSETETVKYTPKVPDDLISIRLGNYNNIINQTWLCRFNNWKIQQYMIKADMTYKNKRSWSAVPDYNLKIFEAWNNGRIYELKNKKKALKGSGPGINKNRIILQRIIDEYIKDGNNMKKIINGYLQNKEIMNKINSTNNIRESGRTKFKRAAAIGGSTGSMTTRIQVEQERRKRSPIGRLRKNKYYKKARKSMKGLRDRVTRRPRNLRVSAEPPNRNLPQTIKRMRDSAQRAGNGDRWYQTRRYSDSLIAGPPRRSRY